MDKNREKEFFLSYCRVQFEGKYNMITQYREVMNIIGCETYEYSYIQRHYRLLVDRYPADFNNLKLEVLEKLKNQE